MDTSLPSIEYHIVGENLKQISKNANEQVFLL